MQTSVVIVKPGGTGMPRLVISARFAPLPPRRLRIPRSPSACPLPKKYTIFLAAIEILLFVLRIHDAAGAAQPRSFAKDPLAPFAHGAARRARDKIGPCGQNPARSLCFAGQADFSSITWM